LSVAGVFYFLIQGNVQMDTNLMKRWAGSLAAFGAMALVGGSAAAESPKEPVAQVSVDETQFGFIVGGSTGGGVLTYKGQEYPFKMGGISLGANIGVSKFSATGQVYDMTDVSQFAGTYARLTGSVALGGGMGDMTLRNENGVIMSLKGTTQGLQLNAGASGVTVTLEK
jgi:hypothetical protein